MPNTKVWLYFTLAFAITWTIWLPLVLQTQFGVAVPLLPYQHYLGSYGPLIAAMLTTLFFEGWQGVLAFLAQIFRVVRQPKWYAFAIGTPILGFVFAAAVNMLFAGYWPDFDQLDVTPKLPGFNLLQAWLFWIFTFGVGEEAGWRGFVLQEMQKIWKPVPASLLLGGIWALWHIPAFFYDKQYMAMEFTQIAGWLLAVLYGAVVFGWIRNATGGSVLIVALWHGTFDALIAGKAAVGIIPAVMSILVIVLASWIIKRTNGRLGYSGGSD